MLVPISKHDCPKKDSPAYKFQTEKYGDKIVANEMEAGVSGGGRCTICGQEI